jgi:UrcA family protein
MFDRRSGIALFSVALMFAAIAPFSASAAGVAAETHKVAVRSSDLDLATQSGQSVLRLRIDQAVQRICGSHPRTTWEAENYANCSQAARADAASQFDAVVAAALNNRKMAADPDKGAPVR